jgi:hypothetical protein
MVGGVQERSILMALELRRPVQELVGLVIVAEPEPPVTFVTFEPLVVHPVAVKAMAVDSGLVPLVVSGGENVSDPVMVVQLIPPRARVGAVVAGLAFGLELEPHAAAEMETRASEIRSGDRTVRMMDMDFPPGLDSGDATPTAIIVFDLAYGEGARHAPGDGVLTHLKPRTECVRRGNQH